MKSNGTGKMHGKILGGVMKSIIGMTLVVCLGGVLLEKGAMPRQWAGGIGALALAVGMMGARSLFPMLPKKWMAVTIWGGAMIVVFLIVKWMAWPVEEFGILQPVLGILTGGVAALITRKGKAKYRVKERR